jgi:hypothetical protein
MPDKITTRTVEKMSQPTKMVIFLYYTIIASINFTF